MAFFGVVGGSGLYEIPGLKITESVKMSSPYGEPSDEYKVGTISGKEVAFLPRHGSLHNVQPHKINYRANIWGFRELGVKRLISIGASGGISSEMKPGAIVVLDQLLDMTSGRKSTFYEEDDVVHIDLTEPFCHELKNYIVDAAEKAGVSVINGGTYLCTDGPRLETAAEIKAFALLGADLVGMTVMPEAVLAREIEICYAGVSVITNHAAGITVAKLTTTEVVEQMQKSTEKIKKVLKAFFALNFGGSRCLCGQALSDARM
jgi:5'-methylthioadenosine phosphorylase